MSNRSLVELNHDFCPKDDKDELTRWASCFVAYMRSGDKSMLPEGVTLKHMRHHSEPDPAAECLGYPRCDGMLPGEAHEKDCPLVGTFGPPHRGVS